MDAMLGDSQAMLTVDHSNTKAVVAMVTVAALLGAAEEMAQLLEHFQPPDAWLWAAQVGQVPILVRLHSYGVALASENTYGQTAVPKAAKGNQPAALEWLLVQRVGPNTADTNGRTPLHWAVEKNAVDCVTLLLAHGADPNKATNDGETPLHWAARDNAVDCLTVLLAHGADPHIANKYRKTPLQIAHSTAAALLAAVIGIHFFC